MGRDPNTPEWTQHLALQVETMDELLQAKTKLEADGIAVVGPVDHTIFKSIYFFDPSGHRLELAVNTGTPKMERLLDDAKWDMLNEWAITKKAPHHARWMHDGSYAGD
jgi:lactoylglutathione lyase